MHELLPIFIFFYCKFTNPQCEIAGERREPLPRDFTLGTSKFTIEKNKNGGFQVVEAIVQVVEAIVQINSHWARFQVVETIVPSDRVLFVKGVKIL